MSIFQLKLFGIIFMVLDHIYNFFPNMPVAFSMLGSISAPLFIFALIEGINHTSNKRQYFFRLYFYSIIVQLSSNLLTEKSGANNYNIIRTFVNVLILITLLEKYKGRGRVNKGLLIFIGYQLISFIIAFILIYTDLTDSQLYLLFTIFATGLTLEGGFFLVFLALVFYYFRDNKKKILIGMLGLLAFSLLFFNTNIILRITNLLARIWPPLSTIFTSLCGVFLDFHPVGAITDIFKQSAWMFIFSYIFILLYNGKKGSKSRYSKYFFYLFYPLHLWILYFISLIL